MHHSVWFLLTKGTDVYLVQVNLKSTFLKVNTTNKSTNTNTNKYTNTNTNADGNS